MHERRSRQPVAGGPSQDASWDPRDPAVLRDQRRAYDEQRRRCPVAHSDLLGWSLFRHADVSAAASDPATYSSATRRVAIPNGTDPPQHTAYRGALEPYFAADRLAEFEPRSRRIARELLGSMLDRAEVEAIGAFVDPFAHQALCSFMGWPVEDWNRISGWAHGNQDAAFRRDPEAGARLAREFALYVTDILQAERATAPRSRIMRELARTTVHGRALHDEQIVALLRTWTAGHGTVAAAMGIVVQQLANDQDLQARLRARPQLVGAAVWEILRVDGPLVANNRTTTRDVELDGRQIAAGERISLMWIAANRDPAVFTDPDRVDLDRDQAENVLFGTGIHRCLGEPLALLNLRVGVEELLRSPVAFAVADSAEPVRQVYPSNGLSSLPLVLRPL
jgi:cytochrome P450